MTIFAVMCALHLPGHPRRAGRGSPTGWCRCPNQMAHLAELPQPAAVGRVRGVSTYVTVSLLFWYVGLIPDLATLRDRATTRMRADRLRHLRARLARLAAPLAALREGVPDPRRPRDAAGALGALDRVASTSPSSQLPGWHTTIFPPYFVAGAIFSRLRDGGDADGDPAARSSASRTSSRCATSRTWTRSSSRRARWSATPTRWSSSSPGTAATPTSGSRSSTARSARTAWAYWTMVTCNVLVAAALLVQEGRARSMAVHVRRLDLRQRRHVVRALRHHRDLAAPRLPAVDLGHVLPDDLGRSSTLVGSFGLFFTLFLLFVRFLPMVAMAEVKAVLPAANPHLGDEGHVAQAWTASPAPEGAV